MPATRCYRVVLYSHDSAKTGLNFEAIKHTENGPVSLNDSNIMIGVVTTYTKGLHILGEYEVIEDFTFEGVAVPALVAAPIKGERGELFTFECYGMSLWLPSKRSEQLTNAIVTREHRIGARK